jgi:hypothetical protein
MDGKRNIERGGFLKRQTFQSIKRAMYNVLFGKYLDSCLVTIILILVVCFEFAEISW